MSVKKPFTVVVCIIIIIILGVVSYLNIGVDMLPGMNLPYIAVVTIYPGAAPETVEKQITDAVESAMSEVGNIKNISSVSAEHYSLVILEFNANADIDKAYQSVNEKLQYVTFPDSDLLQEPILMKINPSMLPIMSLSVGVDGKTIKESSGVLSDAVEKIKGVDGVSSVTTSGLINDLIYVNMKIDRLIDTIVDYLYETFEISFIIDEETKDEMYKALKDADVANMTEEQVIDVIIDTLKNAEVGAEQQIWIDSAVQFLEKEKTDPTSATYKLCTQLLSNQFIFREDADPQLFYSFVDEMTAETVNGVLNGLVGSVFTQVSPDILAQLIYAQDFEMPAGSVTEGSIETIVKIGSGVTTREELMNLPVISFDLGATYAQYFNRVYAILDIISARNEGEEVRFTKEQLQVYIAGIMAGIGEDDPLYPIIEGRTPEEVTEYVIGMLEILNRFSPGAVILPEEGAEDGEYVINLNELDGAIRKLQAALVIPLELNSFADVTYFDNSTASLTYMLTRAINGEEEPFNTSGAVIISVNKEPDKSTVEITNSIISVLDGLKNDEKFEGFKYTVLSNDGDTINFMLDTVLENLLWGGVLAIAILLLFLRNIKSTLVVGSSIVISVVFTFVMMYFAGITLNIVSMGGLALGVGMLVDNSIVVIENIYRMKSQGKGVYVAAIQGAKQVTGAIFASTLTTMIVFLPIAFIEGLTKEIFTDMALTICFSLLASLLVALTLVPMAASTFMKKPQKKETKVFQKVRKGYAKALNFSLKHKVIPLILILVLFALSIFSVFRMDIVLFPESDSSTFTVTATIDRAGLEKYNRDKSDEEYLSYEDAVLEVMEQLRKVVNGTVEVREDEADPRSQMVKYRDKYDAGWVDAIDAAGLYLSTGLSVGGFSLGDKSVKMNVMLINEKQRKIGSGYLTKEINEILSRDEVNKGIFEWEIAGGGMMSSLGMSTESFTVKMYGDDMEKLRADALGFAEKFRETGEDGKIKYSVEGLTSVETGLETDNKEYKIVVDRKKASQYGLTVAQIYLQVAKALSTVSSSNTLNLYTEDIKNENELYIYDASYNTTAWYKCLDADGNEVDVYLKNNVSDSENRADYYLDNYTGSGVFVKTDDTFTYVPMGGKIPLVAGENDFTYSYVYEDEDGEIKTETVTLTRTGKEIYYGVSLIDGFDLMTMNIKSEDMLNTGAPAVNVPLYKLLDDVCFLKDKDGNVIYNESANGELIPSGFIKENAFLSISHSDKKKTVSVTFNYDTEFSSREIENSIKKTMGEYEFTDGVEVELSSGNPYVNEVFQTLIFILALAVVLIYLIMVAQFQSLKSPFIIMFTIPLAFTGGIFAILMAGQPMSVMALMGLIVLVGVVVNNGIVFVDYCNQLIKKGVPKRVALLRTGMDRLRPILMTALTTIVALIIMAADGSEGGALLQPLAITAIGGMVFSTLLTLFIVPIVYDIFNRKARRTARDEALAQADKEVAEDDGIDEWDEDSKAFVSELSGISYDGTVVAEQSQTKGGKGKAGAKREKKSCKFVSSRPVLFGKDTEKFALKSEITAIASEEEGEVFCPPEDIKSDENTEETTEIAVNDASVSEPCNCENTEEITAVISEENAEICEENGSAPEAEDKAAEDVSLPAESAPQNDGTDTVNDGCEETIKVEDESEIEKSTPSEDTENGGTDGETEIKDESENQGI